MGCVLITVVHILVDILCVSPKPLGVWEKNKLWIKFSRQNKLWMDIGRQNKLWVEFGTQKISYGWNLGDKTSYIWNKGHKTRYVEFGTGRNCGYKLGDKSI